MACQLILFMCYLWLHFVISRTIDHSNGSFRECEPIEGSACKSLGYNFTVFPNIFKHETQIEAMRELQKYYPLISVQCSRYIQEFLCTLFIPPCTDEGFHLPPCRSLCEEAQRGCASLHKFPEKFDCNKFPGDHELLCLSTLSNIKYYDPLRWPLDTQDKHEEKNRRQTSTDPPSIQEHIHCISHSDCSLTGSLCRRGECVCEYPKAWGPSGCQYSQVLGGWCEASAECSAITPDAICRDSMCICKEPLTNYRNLCCVHGSEVGSLCYNDAQCRAVNKYSFCRYLVAGVVGNCACDPDQFVNSKGRCVPRLGGRCVKGPCPRELGKATCKRRKSGESRCICQNRAREIRGVCVGWASNGDLDY